MEDNYFAETPEFGPGGFDAADSDAGGRYVFRHNEVHNCEVEVHANRGPISRGGRSWEVYNNTFVRDTTGDQFTAIWTRAGTGVIYNNVVTGVVDAPIVLDNYRSFTVMTYPPASCNGTSNYDGNQSLGWPCRDQIGRGPDQYLWNGTPPAPPQPSEPLYVWNNTLNGSPTGVFVTNNGSAIKPGGSSHDIVAGRDYIIGARPNYTPYIYPHPLIAATRTDAARAAVTDFNGDGSPDYVLQRAGTHQTAIWYLDNNVYVGSALGPTLSVWRLAAVGDFNRDSHADYALFSPVTDRTGMWYLSGPTYVGSAYGPTLPRGWELAAAANFNSDGKPDYLLYNGNTRQTAIYYLDNNVYAASAYGPTLPPGWALVGAADFNGDGKPDYLLYNGNTQQTAIWYLSGVTLIGGHFGPTLPPGWALVATADFNGDGKPDYLLYNANTRQTGIYYLDDNVYAGSTYGPTLPAGWSLVY